MFKFLQRRRDERKADQALIADRNHLPVDGRQITCEKHFWRVNHNSPRKRYYPWAIFFVCEHCRKDLAMSRADVYTRMGIPDVDHRVLIATNMQTFITEIERAMTILREERK